MTTSFAIPWRRLAAVIAGLALVALFAARANAAPLVAITSPVDGGSYEINSAIAASYECTEPDPLFAITSCVGPVDDGDPIDTGSLGPKGFSVTGQNDNGESTTQVANYTVVDTVVPQVTVTTPPAGNPRYQIGQRVLASYSCTDPGGSGILSCSGTVPSGSPIDTGSLGQKSFSVTGTDLAGNTTVVSRPYTVVDTVDPTIDITSPAPGSTHEINSGTPVSFTCADSGSGIASCTATLDGQPVASSDDATLLLGRPRTLVVTAVDNAGNDSTRTLLFDVIDTVAPMAPIGLVPAGPTSDAPPTFQWQPASDPGGSGVDRYQLRVDGQPIADVPHDNGLAVISYTPPAGTIAHDQPHTWLVRAFDVAGNTADSAPLSFLVDPNAPAAPIITLRPPATSENSTPQFAWQGEAGATFTWELLGAGGLVQAGQTIATSVTLGPLSPGAYAFRVRQTDATGNLGGFSLAEPFTVLAPSAVSTGPILSASSAPAAAKPSPRFPRPGTRNTRLMLSPPVGSAVSTLTPVLNWRQRRRTLLYNVQLFELAPGSSRARKVVSAFPARSRYLVPAGRLRFGRRYIVRVWEYLGRRRGYARTPLTISYFDTFSARTLARKRLLSSRARATSLGTRVLVHWRAKARARAYRVRVYRGNRRIWSRLARTPRIVVPRRVVRRSGSYRVIVHASRGRSLRRFGRTPWALGPLRVRPAAPASR